MAYSPKSQKKYNEKMYFATAKLNPDNPNDTILIEKIEQRMKDKSLSRQAVIKEMIEEAK